MSLLLFDIGVPGGTTGLVAAFGFLFILVAVAYIVFRLLRKTVKMAFRMAVVATVLFTFAVGGVALYWFGVGSSSKPARPAPSRQR